MTPTPERKMTLRVTLGEETVQRFESDRDTVVGGWDEPEYANRPAMVAVERVLTIWFGPTTRSPRRSKRLRGVHRFDVDEPTDEQWAGGERLARSRLVAEMERHGLSEDGSR